jgi:hypothetical protein
MRVKANLVKGLLCVLFLTLPVQAKYGGGSGEPNDPYLIYTAEQMNEIGLQEEDQHKHFKLMADIDLSAYSGTAFNMIGVRTTRAGGSFAGVFDGDNHTISNFTYTSITYSGSVGIFAYIRGPNARISNLGLIDPNIDAEIGGGVGSLAGWLEEGTITNCYVANGSISGRRNVGGLVGWNSDHGEIVDCYANGDVLGQKYVGGLVGNNATGGHGPPRSGTIYNCYSAAAVSGDEQVGGLVGLNGDGGVSGSFWDIETSGQTTSDGGVGKTTAEMQDPNTFIDAGWDFPGTSGGPSDIWAEPDGGGYPVLWWQLSPLPELPAFSGGTGEPDEPYLISTADELNSIGHNPRLMAAHFKLIDDIDLADADFFIIASPLYPFRGTFDGNGHTISNFSYTSADATCIGLVGYAVGAEIKDLGLIGPNVNVERGNFHGCLVGHLDTGSITNCYVETGSISGNDYVGGLLGSNSGTITNCYFTGDVYGHNTVGGLVGENSGTVTNCRSSCSVNGSDNTGGLVGDNGGSVMISYTNATVKGYDEVGGLVGSNWRQGEIVNCYAKGGVVGHRYVGGLVGSNATGRVFIITGTIYNCYSAAAVSAEYENGGLYDHGGEVRDSFWDIETSGRTTSYGGTGKTTAELQMATTFLDAGWDFVGESVNGTEDIWSICEGTNYPRLTWQIPAGDFVCPDGFTIEDFLFFAEYWQDENCDLSNDYCQGTDLDFSGTVDADDLEILLENWLAEGELEN